MSEPGGAQGATEKAPPGQERPSMGWRRLARERFGFTRVPTFGNI
jgi:hypothetical protein